MKLNALKGMLELRRIMAAQKLGEFKADFEKDPAHAFEWAERTIDEAAKDHVAQIILKVIEGKGAAIAADAGNEIPVMRELTKHVTDEALRLGSGPPRSSSLASNVTNAYIAAAWAELARELRQRED